MYYRVKSDILHTRVEDGVAAAAGSLVFSWVASQPKLEHGVVAVSADPRGWGRMFQPHRDALEASPALTWRDFPVVADHYFGGREVLPNFEASENLESDLDSNGM
jgi:hypothetical protein